jgi:7-dehydrocholesterol reductase
MIWSPYFLGTASAWKIIGIFAAFELALMRLIPGKLFKGPITPEGNTPIYKANGIACFLITYLTFYLLSFKLKLFSPTIIYDNLGGLLGALCIFSFFFCIFLYIKGIYFPSSSDNGTTGNVIFDFYWGTELYPRIFGWDIKMFTNCRFGMMGWGLILLSCAAKQHELYGISDGMIVCVALQLIYITKFFIWETGYLGSLDIMHDRAGFYICWGVLSWIPCVYTSPGLYLVHHPHKLGIFLSSLFFILGLGCIMINYLADRQRQIVRAKNGDCKIWGKNN